MDYRTKFNISTTGLAEGQQRFDYNIGAEFFEYFSNDFLKKGQLHATVRMNRIEQSFGLDLSINGKVEVVCDRCLELYDFPIQVEHYLIARKKSDCSESDLENDDIIVMKEGEHIFNIAQHIYDFIMLSLPYRKVHPDDESGRSTCNPVLLKHISPEQNNNPKATDPRWDILKKLKNN